MIERDNRCLVLAMPIDTWIGVVGQERCGDACVDGFRIMGTVVGTLPAFGQCRRNGKVEKLVVSRRDLTMAPRGIVTVTIAGVRGKVAQVLGRGNRFLPIRRRFSAEYPQRRAGDQMALKVEGVVDGGVHAQKAAGQIRLI